MKKIFLVLFILPCMLFSQEKSSGLDAKVAQTKQTSSSAKDKGYFIDGKQVDYKTFITLDVQTIDKVEVLKNDPKFPAGRVNITLKK